jgi:O-antigen/teichoic acid export membrane protein
VIERFIFSAGANLIRGALSFLTSVLLARWLGPVTFGDMAFLLGTFLGIRQFLDMGTSSAFFTFLSQRPRSWPFIRNFIFWLAFQFAIPVVVISLIFPDGWIKNFWHDSQRSLVACAFIAVFAQSTLWPVAQSLAESARKTVFVQKIGVIVAAIHLAAVTAFFVTGILNLYLIFISLFVEYIAVFYLVIKNYRIGDVSDVEPVAELSITDYVKYCVPLVPLLIFGAAHEVIDRWLLQTYGGSISQAYFAFSYQIAGMAVLFISAIVKIFWKEIAEIFHGGDRKQLIDLFNKVLRITRVIAGVVAGFIAIYASEIIWLTAGPAYKGAYLTMGILSVYVAYMAVGQIYSTLLMATGKVKAVSYMGSSLSLLSAVLAYVMLATEFGRSVGFANAAENIAIKMLVVEFIASIIYSFIVYKIWAIRFSFGAQFFCVAFGLGIAWLSRHSLLNLISAEHNLTLIISGFSIYSLASGSVIYMVPKFFGLCEGDLPWKTARI